MFAAMLGFVLWTLSLNRSDAAGNAKLVTNDSPPIGTIMAFAGEWPEDNDGKAMVSLKGWFLCEGQSLGQSEFRELFKVIGVLYGTSPKDKSFLLPDLKGVFLRGVDLEKKVDVDSATHRFAFPVNLPKTEPDKREIRTGVGSWQDDATSLPNVGLSTAEDGAHNHIDGVFDRLLVRDGKRTATGGADDDGNTEPNLYQSGTLLPAGGHVHAITGGDIESRPVNVAVYWIIKAE